MVKTKIMPFLPSLREKKRYIAYEVISNEKIRSFNLVSNAIINQATQFLGIYGMAKAGMILLENKWNPESQRGIMKVSHSNVDAVKSALMFADKVDDKEVIIRSLGVSGILRKAEEKYLKEKH